MCYRCNVQWILKCVLLQQLKNQTTCKEQCVLEIYVDHLLNSDVPPLIDALSNIDFFGIDAIDVRQRSSGLQLDEDFVLSLLQVVNCKLRVVEFVDSSYLKKILRYVVLNLLVFSIEFE